MEELLNKLIEKGWKPFGKKAECCLGCRYNNDWSEMYKYVGFIGGDDVVADRKVPLRTLLSVDSGLWQFVCENGMVYEQVLGWEEYHWAKCTADKELREHYSTYSLEYEYRLIESALKDESELEQFLLENIKIDE